jgi:hypothetical protein
LTKQHIWYNASSQVSQAAIMVINTGGRDIVIDKITVRGQETAWTGTAVGAQNISYVVTDQSVSKDLSFIDTVNQDMTTFNLATELDVSGLGNLVGATNDLTLQSGKTIIIYICTPDSITINDIGLTAAVTVFTSQAMYYKETNVQAVTIE